MSVAMSPAVEAECVALLGRERVLTGDHAKAYGASTLRREARFIPAVLRPRHTEDLRGIIGIASRHHLGMYPISGGRNWGYGSASPVSSSVVLDLSDMKMISMENPELGLVTVEPGVSIADLNSYLKKHSLPFLVPVINAGPNSSLIGNALERGTSGTPIVDRFASVMALEALLADGSVYRSPFSHGSGNKSHPVYKWGVGPYLDGLFSQSNMGVVTKMTFALARKHASAEVFIARAGSKDDLEKLVEATREVMQKMGTLVPFVKLQSPERTLARFFPVPQEYQSLQTIPQQKIAEMLHLVGIEGWVALGTVAGEDEVIASSRGIIERIYRSHGVRARIYSKRYLTLVHMLRKYLPRRARYHLALCELGKTYLESAEGTVHAPSRVPLWKLGPRSFLTMKEEFDFDEQEACGLIFFTSVLPMRRENARAFVEITREVCNKYGVNALINLHAISERCFLASFPILFDRTSQEEEERAHACYRELLQRAEESGALMQRLTIESMQEIISSNGDFWRVADRIKEALDPLNIISPGRYSSYTKSKNDRALPEEDSVAS